LARISNSPTVLSNVLAGAAVAGTMEPGATVTLLGGALVLFYTAGMFLNDVCDYAIDRRERPDRPLPAGIVSRLEATAVAAALFGTGSALLFYVGQASFLSGMLLVAVIVLYDLWHKTNPLSPLVMAGTRVLVYLTAFLAFSSQISGSLVAVGVLLALYVVGLTYIAKSETGPAITKFWPAAVLFLPAAYFALQAPSATMLPLLLLFVSWIAYSISFVYRTKGRNVGGAIGRLIAGIALYDSLVLVAADALSVAVLALAAFAATLLLQRYVRGT
jgi:4-hydroxybenzoate polyprenyltransferase